MLSHYFYVRISMTISKRFRLAGLSLMLTGGLLASGLATAKYPDKPITMYIAFAAGGTTDITGRALAQGIEKILGVPVTIENKGGGGATVANGLLASKKPDGYTLLVTSVGSITMRPLLLKLAYNAQSFRPLMQFSYYIGGLVVNADSPIKTVDEFVDYAKKNPGLTYSSSGPHTQQQIGVEAFARCKGLVFKHMPTKGGSTANTALMGKHVDFVAGSGSHILLVEQGQFRELVKRPDIPVMKDIGCPPTNPPSGMIVVAPAGLPDAVAATLEAALKQIAESPEFKQLLVKYNLPYAYEDGATVASKFPAEIEWYTKYFKETGLLK
jgi:tripartite-type tricarboxylate transporter receptor subunit TctC